MIAPPTLRLAALGLTVAGLVLSCTRSAPGPGPDDNPEKLNPPTVDPQDAAASLFHPDSLYHFEVTVEDSSWDWLNKHVVEEEYIPAGMKVRGQEFKNVGIRYKGAYGTLRLCFDGAGKLICEKLSLKISFDEYEKKQKFQGLKRLNFHSMSRDPTKLHDRLANHLFRETGIPSARSAHATLSVNGRSLGLFALLEQIDEEFVESRFPRSGDGNLYKEVWPQSIEPGPYLEALENNRKKGDATPMTRFAGKLKSITAENHKGVLDSSVDVDYLLRYLAVDQVITNWDGATTFYCSGGQCRPHNLYWYQEESSGKLWLIPWDLDATFGSESLFPGQPEWNNLEIGCTPFQPMPTTTLQPAACDPLFNTLARYYPEEYRKTLQTFLGSAFDIPKLHERIDRWAAQIEPHLEKDPTRAQSMAQWKMQVHRLKETLPLLLRNAQRRSQSLPIVPFGLFLDSTSGFEGWLPIELEAAVTSFANSKSEVGHRLNPTLPLAGSHDFRLGFTFRNESDDSSGAWKHYVTSRMPFPLGAAIDLKSKSGIRFIAKADTARMVRLDIASAKYSNPFSGVFFGWEVVLGVEAKEYTLDLANLSLPSWGKPIPETLEDILSAANGLQWSPYIIGRGGNTGLLIAGAEDEGFIQIDDIRFIP